MQTWKIKKKTVAHGSKTWKPRAWAILGLIAIVVTLFYDFPGFWNQGAKFVEAKTGWLPPTLEEKSFRLGLDLQGGTHLVYEADMTQIPEEDRLEALEGVRDVIERRVNAFGVSEPVVQITSTGGSYRVVIELAGVLEVSEAIALIGETPVLEFKVPGEELDREPTKEELDRLDELNTQERAAAQEVLNRARAQEDFDSLVAQYSTDRNKETTKGIIQRVTSDSFFGEYVLLLEQRGAIPGQVNGNLLENEEGISVFKYLESTNMAQMQLSHILICFEGKTGCTNELTALDASIQITNLKDQATTENFGELAKQYSTDPSAVSNSGDLGWSTADAYVASFGLASEQLEIGQISSVVETEYGYHLILKRDERTIPAYTIQRVLMPFSSIYDVIPQTDEWVNTSLSGKHLTRAAVEFDPSTGSAYVAITFNGEGADLFATLTQTHVGQPMAIFLDGSAISTPVVQQAIYGGQAVITGNFTVAEAKMLSQRLNAGALPVALALLSQQTVGPTLGATSLSMSVKAALVGFTLVAIYMIAYYRLAGFFSVVALMLYALLNLAIYRVFGVTITLSGVAGFILSLGMAVDANVLIIERMKEELASGRDFAGATREGFLRAWPAIRDSNVATLVVAIVLYVFSTSFVRGFALLLGIGVLVSMFTAVVITRSFMDAAFPRNALKIPWLSSFSKSPRT
ncbi:protein translocase subunit SecD [Candidatus Uhrbacteria bacterium]|nr:protein translocase subunit SecD [Candidatus Uhrbacteria bacterium]